VGVLPGDEDGEKADDEDRDRRAAQQAEDEIVRDGQEPLVQRRPAGQLVGVVEADGGVGFGSVVVGGQLEVERRVIRGGGTGRSSRPATRSGRSWRWRRRSAGGSSW
jgi:hypothetical protein